MPVPVNPAAKQAAKKEYARLRYLQRQREASQLPRSSKEVVEGIVNAAYNKRIRDAYVRLTNHQVFKGVAGQAALTINEGATQAPFDRDQYKVCMDRGDEYKCGGNGLWCDPLYNPTPNVPVRMDVFDNILLPMLAGPPTKINTEFTIAV